jgi:hypothetical protein
MQLAAKVDVIAAIKLMFKICFAKQFGCRVKKVDPI